MFRLCGSALVGFACGFAYVDLVQKLSLELPKLSSNGECHALYQNRHSNYWKLTGYSDYIDDDYRIKIANDCIDFKFTPATIIIGEYFREDGRISSDIRYILPDGIVTDKLDRLVHANKLSLQILGIEDCVNNYDNPSEAKKECLPKIVMRSK